MPSHRELLLAELAVAELEEQLLDLKGKKQTPKVAEDLAEVKTELRDQRRAFRDMKFGTSTDERGRSRT